MSNTIEVDGESYDVDDNPSLRTVRSVQSMQMDIIKDYVGEEKLMEMDSLEDEGEIIQIIIESEGYEGFQNVMWERSMLEPVQTISLACDEHFSPDDFDSMGSKDFMEAREAAEEALDGSATDFFSSLGLGMSLTEEQIQEQARKAQET